MPFNILKDASDQSVRRAVLILLWMLITAGALVFLATFRPLIITTLNILSPFIVALIVAYIFNPLVFHFQRRWKVGRLGAVVATYMFILLMFAAAMSFLVPVVYRQARAGIASTVEFVKTAPPRLQVFAEKHNIPLNMADIEQARDALEGKVDWQEASKRAGPLLGGVYKAVATLGGWVTKFAVLSVSVVLGFFGFLLFVVMVTFYFLVDYSKIGGVVRTILPDDREARFFDLWRKVDTALSGLLRGQLIVCCLITVLYSAGLFVLGMKEYSILVGLIAGFGNLIPYFGPLAGGVPSVLWVIFGGHYVSMEAKVGGVIAVLVLSVAIQALDGLFFQVRIVGKSANLHPVVVLLALVVGAQFGLGGLILAVPVTVVVRVLLKNLWWDKLVAAENAAKQQPAPE